MATTYYVRSTDGSDLDDGSTWALAKATLAGAAGALSVAVAGDTIWVSQSHAETQITAHTVTFPTTAGLRILCGNDAAEPPTALATTASVATTGNAGIVFAGGHALVYGIIFSADTDGGSNSSADITFQSNTGLNAVVNFTSCQFRQGSTNNAAPFHLAGGSGVDQSVWEFNDCTFKFGATTQYIEPVAGKWRFRNLALDASGSIPTTLFIPSTGASDQICILDVESSDLSARAFTNLLTVSATKSHQITFRNMKTAATTFFTGTHAGHGGVMAKVYNVDSADTHIRFAESRGGGTVISEGTIVKTSGASDGSASHSWKMASDANVSLWMPLFSPEVPIRQNTVGGAITVTMDVVTDNVTLTDGEAWIEVQYLGTSGFPQGTIVTDRVATFIAATANQTTSSATWTTTGLTTPVKQKFSVTFTPAEAGVLICRVALAKATTTMYVDPLPVIS